VLTSLLAAAGVGLLGGAHCAFMCGPLIAAGCRGRGARAGAAYLGGRLLSHATAGAIFGALGIEAMRALSGSTLPLLLLGAVATALLARGVTLLLPPRPVLATLGRGPRLGSRVAAFAASLVPRRALPLGLATGVLPCGLLAGAWALAAATANPLEGALVMTTFSLASAPGLALALLVALRARRLTPFTSRALQGALWCALAVFVGIRPILFGVHACCR
jgi:sulfite exporter TauE/SafE